jgi:hypothetical protein
MKTIISFLAASSFVLVSYSQNLNDDLRGPTNLLSNGVMDGVVMKEEVPVRSKVEYEHVRHADYVWSKRVFSRIDKREKINHVLFFPEDFFDSENFKAPSSANDVNSPYWIKHQERLSLWTIIMKHIMLGDLTVFRPSDRNMTGFILQFKAGNLEDGYSFKYPVKKNNSADYFKSAAYKSEINQLISATGPGPKVEVTINGNKEILTRLDKVYKTANKPFSFKIWYDSVVKLETQNPSQNEILLFDSLDLRNKFEQAGPDGFLAEDGPIAFQSSRGVVAYNIKEDWFFDKERSILDRRIIAIAPIAEYVLDSIAKNDSIGRGQMVVIREDAKASYIPQYFLKDKFVPLDGPTGRASTIQKEMFWLYFPELRDILVNYYVYNEDSDSQWMSFDDLFWKRKFSSIIYRVSDKFDREIEDYKYGVDALYEAERIKDDIRKWEIDVWNY